MENGTFCLWKDGDFPASPVSLPECIPYSPMGYHYFGKHLVKLARDLTRPKNHPKGSVLEGKSPAISGKSRLVKYYNLARLVIYIGFTRGHWKGFPLNLECHM